jgi:rhodanese-related sulfurtransferase
MDIPSPESAPEATPLSPRQLGPGTYLLDVREDEEWAAGHAPEAHRLPMADVPSRLGEVPTAGVVAVICRSGHRSAHVVAYLRAQGWGNVHNVAGGMMEWQRLDLPLVSETGAPPQIK